MILQDLSQLIFDIKLYQEIVVSYNYREYVSNYVAMGLDPDKTNVYFQGEFVMSKDSIL